MTAMVFVTALETLKYARIWEDSVFSSNVGPGKIDSTSATMRAEAASEGLPLRLIATS